VNSNFSIPPFQYAELKMPGIHTLLSSNEILDGPHTFTLVYATNKFHDANPRTYQAFLAAIKEAIDLINSDKPRVAKVYLEMTGSKEKLDDILTVLDDPKVKFTMTPDGTMKFAGFMHRIGSLKTMPASWKDYFFGEIHELPGS
jgi:NitT/TauT family transport system substrate-binding protein